MRSFIVSMLRRSGILEHKPVPEALTYASYLMHQRVSRAENERWLKKVFYESLGYNLSLTNPRTFNEKINWMKLNYRHPDMPRITDKHAFKHYIEEKLGVGYTVPLLGAWDNEEDIDFDALPDAFVLKSNNSANGNNIIIVRKKSELDIPRTRHEVSQWLQPWNTLNRSFCWAYQNVKPLIIAEEYIEQINGQLYDYKYFCFNGKPKYCYVGTEHFVRGSKSAQSLISMYDLEWNKVPLTYGVHKPNTAGKPRHHLKMIQLAAKLSKDFIFCRVDFYEAGDRVYVGEMTFYPGGGFNRLRPVEWDLRLGQDLRIEP